VKLDNHIHTLLYQHDCVIVPDFGGFVANYAPATIHPVHHTFSPPSKKISFNKNLRNNDGLLANYVSTTEHLDYNNANHAIVDFVHECKSQLASNKKCEISQVGLLSLDVEGNIQFQAEESVNHLMSSIGLVSFISPAIKRESLEKRIEKKIKDREPIPLGKKKSRRGRYVALAIALPVMFALVWIPLKTEMLKHINYSALNPFAEKIKPEYIEHKASALVLSENDFTEPALVSDDDTSAYQRLALLNDPKAAIIVRLKEQVLAEKAAADKTSVVSVKKVNGKLRFHVVGGCFQVMDNAEKFISILKNKNISASVIGKTPAGLNIVSCGDFATREEALSELAKIRESNTEAWLLKL